MHTFECFTGAQKNFELLVRWQNWENFKILKYQNITNFV